MKRQPELNYSQSNSKYDNRMQGLFYLPAPDIRNHLKNVFWPAAFFGGIGAAFQILNPLRRTCGLKIGLVAILNQNPIFEMASYKKAEPAMALPF
jgi:hypothetical protein